MVSVVIAAHNEAAVIGRCLEALLQQRGAPGLDVTVVANGCRDATAAVAREFGVRVVDLAQAGKSPALAAGDAVAVGFPRIYLDADIQLPADAVAMTETTFAGNPTVLAAAPRRRMVSEGCTLPVRCYVAINQRLPAFQHSLFGRGMIALTEAGRARFDTFPTMIADDLFLDSLFAASEKGEITSVEVSIAAPRRSGPLLQRLIRVRRGNTELREASSDPHRAVTVRRPDRLAWLTAVVVPHPHLLPAGVVYAAMTLAAAVVARRQKATGTGSWGRDVTTRDDSGGPSTARSM